MKNIVILTWDIYKYAEASEILNQNNLLLLSGFEVSAQEYKMLHKKYDNILIRDKVDFKKIENMTAIISRWNAKIDSIISIDELCLLPAAYLRDFYNINGDQSEDILFFRNKEIMISKLRNSNVKYPYTRRVDSIADILEVINCFGKVVVKPLDGVGSKRTYVFDKESIVDEIAIIFKYRKKFIVQEYIEGDLYHVDSVISNEEPEFINIMKYLESTLDFETNNYLRSITIDSEYLTTLIEDFTKEVVKIFQINNNIIHLELFVKDNMLTFCEIAIRAGGAGVVPVVEHKYGINLYLRDIGRQLQIKIPKKPVHNFKYSWIVIHPREGVIEKIVGTDFLEGKEWIFSHSIHVEVGMKVDKALFSSHSLATICIYADSHEQLASRLHELEQNFNILIAGGNEFE